MRYRFYFHIKKNLPTDTLNSQLIVVYKTACKDLLCQLKKVSIKFFNNRNILFVSQTLSTAKSTDDMDCISILIADCKPMSKNPQCTEPKNYLLDYFRNFHHCLQNETKSRRLALRCRYKSKNSKELGKYLSAKISLLQCNSTCIKNIILLLKDVDRGLSDAKISDWIKHINELCKTEKYPFDRQQVLKLSAIENSLVDQILKEEDSRRQKLIDEKLLTAKPDPRINATSVSGQSTEEQHAVVQIVSAEAFDQKQFPFNPYKCIVNYEFLEGILTEILKANPMSISLYHSGTNRCKATLLSQQNDKSKQGVSLERGADILSTIMLDDHPAVKVSYDQEPTELVSSEAISRISLPDSSSCEAIKQFLIERGCVQQITANPYIRQYCGIYEIAKILTFNDRFCWIQSGLQLIKIYICGLGILKFQTIPVITINDTGKKLPYLTCFLYGKLDFFNSLDNVINLYHEIRDYAKQCGNIISADFVDGIENYTLQDPIALIQVVMYILSQSNYQVSYFYYYTFILSDTLYQLYNNQNSSDQNQKDGRFYIPKCTLLDRDNKYIRIGLSPDNTSNFLSIYVSGEEVKLQDFINRVSCTLEKVSQTLDNPNIWKVNLIHPKKNTGDLDIPSLIMIHINRLLWNSFAGCPVKQQTKITDLFDTITITFAEISEHNSNTTNSEITSATNNYCVDSLIPVNYTVVSCITHQGFDNNGHYEYLTCLDSKCYNEKIFIMKNCTILLLERV